jgi:amidase
MTLTDQSHPSASAGDFATAIAATLERIATDQSGAVVTVCTNAVVVARELERAASPGPLAGVPFTAKDVLASAGVPSQAGSRALAGYVPDDDAPAIALLRAAGAVLVGKTNCSELALTPWTGNALFPETRHPHEPGRSPGGSSGGCAAAIAGGLVPLSVGADYGGSVRLPAAACGIVALRPTPGRVPSGGQLPPPPPGSPREAFSVVGPLGRDVHHLHAALRVLDPQHAAPLPAEVPGPVAVGAEEPAARAVGAALERAGLSVIVAQPPFMAAAERCFTALRDLDTYDDLRRLVDRLGPALRALIARAPRTLDEAAHARHARRAELLRARADEFMAQHPLLVLPVARCELPPPAGAPVSFDDLGPCRAISLLGLPAVAIAGVQIVAQRGRDEDALAAAAWIERDAVTPTR